MKGLSLVFALPVLTAVAVDLSAVPWIGDGRPERSGADWYEADPVPEFSAAFVLPQGVSVQRGLDLSCASPGYLQVRVNGRPIGAQSAEDAIYPLWSPFDKTIYAETFRIGADGLHAWPCTNRVTVTLGNGWYNMPPLRFWGKFCFREHLAHGRPCFKLAIAGVSEPLSWYWRETDVVQNSIQLGAVVDRTRPVDRVWKPAATVAGPRGRIVPRQAPPVAPCASVRAVRVDWLREGERAVVDFGENLTGLPFFCLSDTVRGDRVEIVYGERLNDDGSVNVLTQTAGQIKRPGLGGPGAPDVAAQRDVLVCRGGMREPFAPPFAWHVGRYAEIRGIRALPAEAAMRPLRAQVSDAQPGGRYLSGRNDFNRLHEVCRRTFLNNLIGVQSDCPGRERLGYGGDIVVTCEAMMLNFDMKEFYLKTLQDFADEAEDDGWITETAPYVGIGDKGFAGSTRSGPISWALVVPTLMDGLIRHYPDTKDRVLKFYPVCTRFVALVDAANPSGIIPRCIGDHEALERAPDEVTATAHWYAFVRLSAKFAAWLGRADEQRKFESLADKIAEAFQAKYVKGGVIANGTQSAQAIALYLGLVPANQIAAAEARLLKAIEEKDGALSTGIFSTRYLLLYLSEHGHRDVTERIVLRRGFPGWLHMLERGATTLWESWAESDNVYSNCHPMFGSVDEWLLKYAK